ncbi:putative chitin synthase 1, partial [Pseudohyphozyma bogoriensis]
WLFNGFARQLNPEVCILIDAGTKPSKLSLFELWAVFNKNKHVGGACGEIYVMTEYKMSNILDKPLESTFGYVSVLPGAFSAYRWSALQGRPLEQQAPRCFEIVNKSRKEPVGNGPWLLTYIKSAKGETDVPETAAEFISQRRRWLNGSTAASIYSIIHFTRSDWGSCGFGLQFILALGNRPKGESWTYVCCFVIFAICAVYLSVCAIWLTVLAFIDMAKTTTTFWSLFSSSNGVVLAAVASTYGLYVVSSLMYLDPYHLVTSFVQYTLVAPSMTNILMVYAFCNWHDVSWGTKGSTKVESIPAAQITKGKDGKGQHQVTHRTPHEQQEDLDKHIAAMSTKVHESHDKPSPQEKEDDGNRTFRTRLVLIWIVTNAALVITVQQANGLNTTDEEEASKKAMYFAIILYFTAALSAVRFIGSLIYWVLHLRSIFHFKSRR